MNPIPNPVDYLNNSITGGVVVDPSKGISFFTNNLIPFLINGALFLVFILALIFLVIGGIRWMMSGGEKQAVTAAKNTVTYAIVGLVLALLSVLVLVTLDCVLRTHISGLNVCP